MGLDWIALPVMVRRSDDRHLDSEHHTFLPSLHDPRPDGHILRSTE